MTGPTAPDEWAAIHEGLFAAYPDALLLVDTSGHIVLANPAAHQLLGYESDELHGLAVDALVPDAIRPRHAEYRAQYAQHPRTRPMGGQMELVARRRDGSEVMVEIALSPLRSGPRPLVVAAIRGIAAYPRVQQALLRARYSDCVAQLGRLAVDSRDPQALLQHMPQAALQALQADAVSIFLLGPDRQQLGVAGHAQAAAAESSALVPTTRPAVQAAAAHLANQVLAQGAAVVLNGAVLETPLNAQYSAAPGALRSAVAVPVTARGQVMGVLLAHSHRRNAFEGVELQLMESLANLLASSLQRSHTEEALSHAQRLESVGQLTGGIAHDFNNLLTIIQGNIQILEDHVSVAGDDDAQALLASTARATRRAAELTSKLLAFSRRQVLSPREVDCAALVRSLVELLSRTLEQHIQIALELENAPTCLVDPGQLEAALLNLALNARDAMPEGGKLGFKLQEAVELSADVAEELAAGNPLAPGYVRLDVFDTGHGMTPAVRERAFEPFFSTKALGRGTGLGLSTVYGFVKQSQGALRLVSSPQAGTTVSLYLPCTGVSIAVGSPSAVTSGASSFALSNAPTGTPPVNPSGTSRPTPQVLPLALRVLLIEDEPEIRALVDGFLRNLGCEPQACDSAEAALALLDEGAAVDLVLSDVALGAGMRGTSLLSRLQTQRPDLALLLMSGYALDGQPAPSPRDVECLRKPFTRDELAQALHRAWSARQL